MFSDTKDLMGDYCAKCGERVDYRTIDRNGLGRCCSPTAEQDEELETHEHRLDRLELRVEYLADVVRTLGGVVVPWDDE